MIYCRRGECPYKDCERHESRAPRGCAVTVREEACERFERWRKRMEGMTMGQALSAFYNIDGQNAVGGEVITEEEKGLAIWKVLNMETHNSITKAAMLKVMRYLLGLAFELPEEGKP